MIPSLLLLSLLAAGPPPEATPELPADPFAAPRAGEDKALDEAFARFLTIVRRKEHTSSAWAEQSEAAEALMAFGEPAALALSQSAEDDEEIQVRKACFYWLNHRFLTNPWVQATVIRSGLSDPDPGIRQECAFYLGEHRVYAAYRQLRGAMKAAKPDEEYVRLAAAKSLAELGEADVLPILYEALGSDRYMHRHMANLGIKGLTGKDLNDFDYNYGEGAFVSGGVESTYLDIHGIEYAEKKARRFRALASYCRWLKATHPRYYKYLDAAYSAPASRREDRGHRHPEAGQVRLSGRLLRHVERLGGSPGAVDADHFQVGVGHPDHNPRCKVCFDLLDDLLVLVRGGNDLDGQHRGTVEITPVLRGPAMSPAGA